MISPRVRRNSWRSTPRFSRNSSRIDINAKGPGPQVAGPLAFLVASGFSQTAKADCISPRRRSACQDPHFALLTKPCIPSHPSWFTPRLCTIVHLARRSTDNGTSISHVRRESRNVGQEARPKNLLDCPKWGFPAEPLGEVLKAGWAFFGFPGVTEIGPGQPLPGRIFLLPGSGSP